MNTRQKIDIFINEKRLAIAGVSRNPKKFGHLIYKTLKGKGYLIVPINPNGGTIDGSNCIKSLSELDKDIHNLLVVTNKHETEKVVKEAISKGIKNIWIQNGCETEEVIKIAGDQDINLVTKACFLMYANPKGFHKFHQTIAKWTGKYVKAK